MKKTFSWTIHFQKTLDVPDGQDPFDWFCENGVWDKEMTFTNNEVAVEFNPDELDIEA